MGFISLRYGLRLLAVITLTYLGVVAFFYFHQRDFLYPGQTIVVESERPNISGLQAFWIPTTSGRTRTEAWYLPPLQGTAPFPAIVFGHGNAEVIDHWVKGLDEIRNWGVAVMLVEYPGFGRSKGSPSAHSIQAAMVGAYDRLRKIPEIDPRKIVGYGQSLGGGAICSLASRRPLAALILQSTFTTTRFFAHRLGIPDFLTLDRFENATVLEQFTNPVLVIHGQHDPLIPVTHAQQLAQIAPQAELHLYPCAHGCWDPPYHHSVLRDIRLFFESKGLINHSSN